VNGEPGRWEYIVVELQSRATSNRELDAHQAELNRWGEEGWELVAVWRGLRAADRAYFKRPRLS
jgi:Domain of unknown function (DUF4177)